MKRLGIVVVGLVVIAARSASAQDTSRGELSGGWRSYHATFSPASATIRDHRKGWYADAAFNISQVLAIVGETGGTSSSSDFSSTGIGVTATATTNLTFHTFMGGVRLRAPFAPGVVPYAQVVFGGEHDETNSEQTLTTAQRTERRRQEMHSNSAALAFDGGATVLLGRIGVRASAGYARFFPTADFAVDFNAFRFSLGAAFRF